MFFLPSFLRSRGRAVTRISGHQVIAGMRCVFETASTVFLTRLMIVSEPTCHHHGHHITSQHASNDLTKPPHMLAQVQQAWAETKATGTAEQKVLQALRRKVYS